jgi:F-type H+-transporting ATPase subunit epsilon
MSEQLQLKILLPFITFLEQSGVTSVVAETEGGAFGILPHRLDCVAALTPGILSYRMDSQNEQYIAIDEGVLVKTGLLVLVSVRRAVGGADLNKLHALVEEEYRLSHVQEKAMHTTLIKLETGFLRRFASFQQE